MGIKNRNSTQQCVTLIVCENCVLQLTHSLHSIWYLFIYLFRFATKFNFLTKFMNLCQFQLHIISSQIIPNLITHSIATVRDRHFFGTGNDVNYSILFLDGRRQQELRQMKHVKILICQNCMYIYVYNATRTHIATIETVVDCVRC